MSTATKLLKVTHADSAYGTYTDRWPDGTVTNVRRDIMRSSVGTFVWGPAWHSFEPLPGQYDSKGVYQPRKYQADVLAAAWEWVNRINQDGLLVCMCWVNPYPVAHVNASIDHRGRVQLNKAMWTAGNVSSGCPARMATHDPWARLLYLVTGWLDGQITWGEVLKLPYFDPASLAAAEAFGISNNATAKVHYSVPWGEMNASNPANNQQPGITEPIMQAKMMRVAAEVHDMLHKAGHHPAMLLGPALLDGAPHNVNWGWNSALIPCGAKKSQFTDDSWHHSSGVTRKSTCSMSVNNHVTPGYDFDQYFHYMMSDVGGLAGWEPKVPVGLAIHLYQQVTSLEKGLEGTAEGFSRQAAHEGWHDITDGHAPLYATEQCFQGWNVGGRLGYREGVVATPQQAAEVLALQYRHIRGNWQTLAKQKWMAMFAHYLFTDSIRLQDGSIAWMGFEGPPVTPGGEMQPHEEIYNWWTSFK